MGGVTQQKWERSIGWGLGGTFRRAGAAVTCHGSSFQNARRVLAEFLGVCSGFLLSGDVLAARPEGRNRLMGRRGGGILCREWSLRDTAGPGTWSLARPLWPLGALASWWMRRGSEVCAPGLGTTWGRKALTAGRRGTCSRGQGTSSRKSVATELAALWATLVSPGVETVQPPVTRCPSQELSSCQ